MRGVVKMMCQALPAMNPRSTLPTFHPLRFAFLWQWFWGVSLRSSGHRIYTALPQGYFRFAFDSARRFAREDPRITDHNRERADPGHSSSVPGPDRVSKDHDNQERIARNQNWSLWTGPAAQPGRGPLLAPTMARSRYAQGRGCRAQELGS